MINLKLGNIKEQLPQRIVSDFCEKAFVGVNSYPENYSLLIGKLAKKHKAKPQNIVLTNGVDEAIELIARVFGKSILIFTPTYYEFLDAARRNNLKIKTVDCFHENKYSLKYKDLDIKKSSLIFLCNPNNPFGILTKQEIAKIAGKTRGIVAIDETYIDFNGETAISISKSFRNILVLRSFSKSCSLAGLRIGYIVGEKSLIEKIRQKKLFYNVTSVSVYAAIIALEEKKYFQGLIIKIKKRKDSFEDFLAKKGFNVIHTHTNNIVIKFSGKKAAGKFCSHLKENAVIANQGNGISTCGLDNSFVCFACGTEAQMKQVAGTIEKIEKRFL
jgi:histidinol-phosphate aminotransferase